MRDKWILILGIPILGFLMPMIFNKFSIDFLFNEGYRNTVMSIATTIAIWLGIRSIVIYLWHHYPWEKNPIKHLIYEIILVFSYTMLIGFLNYIIYQYTSFVEMEENLDLGISITITLLITFFITSLHEAWFFFNQWNISLVKAQTLEKENIISQYETLKTQINPHFLFNTLNTITILIEESPQMAVKYVGKTADFLRGILSMKDKEVIKLEEEMGMIETFFDLQKERYGQNLHVDIKLSPASLLKNIPPLALQMLIENAIKHNIISAEKPLYIQISDEDARVLSVSNNLQKKKQENLSNGIGLQNIQKRYSFLSDSKIEIIENEQVFKVTLPLLKNS